MQVATQFISIGLPDLRGGGAERLHINLANAWIRLGYRVEFILMRDQGELKGLLPAGATMHELGVDRIRSAMLPLRRYLRQRRPDVTLVAMWPLTSVAVVAWVLAGRIGRLLLSDHNQLSIDCIEELGTSPWMLKHSLHLTYPLATGIIAVSKGVKADLCELGDLKPESVNVIYNPAAIETLPSGADPELRVRLWGSGNGFSILAVGTLKTQKDHATLLRAMALLPDSLAARLVILGDGPLRDDLVALCEELGLGSRVRFAGFVTDPTDWLRTADLFVLSSRWEGFANVIVEALSFGVPVVSTNCRSGPSEILKDGRYGTLVPVRDPTGMAKAIVEGSGQWWDRELLVSRSRDFAVNKIARQYLRYMDIQENGDG